MRSADPHVELTGIPELNAEGESMAEIAYDAANATCRRDPDGVAESVRRAVRAAIATHWGKKPMCHVHVLTI